MTVIEFAKLIRIKRKELGYRQLDVALELGMSYRHYQSIEAGKVDMKYSTFLKLVRFYDLNVSVR